MQDSSDGTAVAAVAGVGEQSPVYVPFGPGAGAAEAGVVGQQHMEAQPAFTQHGVRVTTSGSAAVEEVVVPDEAFDL